MAKIFKISQKALIFVSKIENIDKLMNKFYKDVELSGQN